MKVFVLAATIIAFGANCKFLNLQTLSTLQASEDCSNYQGLDTCKSSETTYPMETEERRWQSPSSSPYHNIQSYPRVSYSSAGNSFVSAEVEVITLVRCKGAKVQYKFGDNAAWTPDNKFKVYKKDFIRKLSVYSLSNKDEDDLYLKGLEISVWSPDCDNTTLILDPLYFIWQNPPLPTTNNFNNGQRGAIVELFGWPFDDVAKECKFLSSAGYMGVKIFPAQEHIESYHYLQNGELNPWYFSYQPISYRLHSRLGTPHQLRKMILSCRKVGVRVYADAVINHMTGGGNDILTHRQAQPGGRCAYWGPKNSTFNSPYFTHSFTFEESKVTGRRPALEYPGVPYGPTDFHCERPMNDWASGFALNYGWLVGLADLDTGKPFVRQRIADFFVDLLAFGFSGFRVDAAKHVQPVDLAGIFGRFRGSLGGYLPVDFVSWLEVIIGGEKDLLACGDGDYSFYNRLDRALKEEGFNDEDISKVKIWSSDYPKEHPICGRWILPASRFVIQNDDHDQQNPGSSSRDMADKGSVLIKERNVERHRMFEKQLFERTDANWSIKTILSSYTFMESGAQGYPDGKSDCTKYLGNPFTSPYEQCKTVPFARAYDQDSCGYSMIKDGKWLEGVYTRVHRDREIIMAMRRWTGLSTEVDNEQLCQIFWQYLHR